MRDLPFTLPALREAYAAGASPKDVIAEVYRRIANVNDPGIFIHLRDEAEAESEAESLGAFDPAKPLWGIPFAVKDNIDVAGMPTTAACPDFSYDPEADAFVVARLRAAGAIVIGKTNLDQFAAGLVGVRSPYPIPKNALDPAIVPGGSSSGSGVVVAHGIVPFSLGTDTAGSGRVPAALNNIVGLKPSLGAFSATGVVPACRSLDTISVFAMTVDDAYAVFELATAYDPADAWSRKIPAPPLSPVPPALRIGIPDAASIEFCGDDVQKASFDATVARLKDMGAAIVPVDFTPLYAVARMLYEGAWVAERHAVIEDRLRDKPETVHPVTRTIVEKALPLTATDAFRGIYRLKDLIRQAEPALASVDLLCVPTMPTFYTVADLEADPIGPNSRLGTYTNFVNLMDMCGIAVPVAARSDSRPGSVTLLAPKGRDSLVASLARNLEVVAGRTLGATTWPSPALSQAPNAVSVRDDEIAIAVCGAHMSGMPLNPGFVDFGARFLGAASTAPVYRLFALSKLSPERPGLVQVGKDKGAAIDLELWSLPRARFADFLLTIAPPLGIGSVLLADGTAVPGFLCEAIAGDETSDITHYGGWRPYVQSLERSQERAVAVKA
ncbi:Allophanate hydrolase [Hartmannibacter diazotrophicus]|uniref:Allophanate hydrolase n=1 Tax=Hartmannibacter diazotrophicus TaxID=1482074 RepID=A0A2C9D988_9HYPH|nr:allophanate hydrolase [Hartmannibacter diazotrophicus]SON56882.1 Allophanate hydrolase [Hartmannibacter diazotrophicus]